MPFTPYHFGPGLLLKSIGPAKISFLSFAAANVIIDLESLYHLLRHESPVHRWAHTFLGAGAIGILTGLLLAVTLRRFSIHPASRPGPFKGELEAIPLILGGFLGGITHPFLDGLMHFDIRPFLPFSPDNPLLGIVSVESLLEFCLVTGLIGVIILIGQSLWKGAA